MNDPLTECELSTILLREFGNSHVNKIHKVLNEIKENTNLCKTKLTTDE